MQEMLLEQIYSAISSYRWLKLFVCAGYERRMNIQLKWGTAVYVYISRIICIDCGPRSAGEANLTKCSCLSYNIVQDLAANRLSSGRFWLFCALFCFQTLVFLSVLVSNAEFILGLDIATHLIIHNYTCGSQPVMVCGSF